MRVESWKMTLLDQCHDPIARQVVLEPGELPVISFFASDGNWTLYTTHRLLGEKAGVRTEIAAPDFKGVAFGDLKQGLGSPVVEAVMRCGEIRRVFLYESGYASMAPIYYFRFWSLKWPVWKETYRWLHGS